MPQFLHHTGNALDTPDDCICTINVKVKSAYEFLKKSNNNGSDKMGTDCCTGKYLGIACLRFFILVNIEP